MPDALTIYSARDPGLSVSQIIKVMRQPLPSHEIEGGNFRKWAVAVCQAEVNHRARDYLRIERALNLNSDRWDFPNDVSRGQYRHEAHAGAALHWLSHLQAHETTRRVPFDFSVWKFWTAERRAAWIARRQYLWAGFLGEVRAYQRTRKEAGL